MAVPVSSRVPSGHSEICGPDGSPFGLNRAQGVSALGLEIGNVATCQWPYNVGKAARTDARSPQVIPMKALIPAVLPYLNL